MKKKTQDYLIALEKASVTKVPHRTNGTIWESAAIMVWKSGTNINE